MKQYLDIVQHVLDNGQWKENRTGIPALTCFNFLLSHDLSNGFPLLTTRKIPLKSVAIELEGFIKGVCSKKWYLDRGCKYWKYWCNPLKITSKIDKYLSLNNTTEDINSIRKQLQIEEDDLGTFYPHSFRRFNETYDENDNGCLDGIDQLENIVDCLKTNPDDRRMLCINYNPVQLNSAALPACHILWMVGCLNSKLNLTWVQRSCDLMLGIPSNLASYSLLLLLLCKETGLLPGVISGQLFDTHIYKNHLHQAKEQLQRNTYPLPTVEIPDTIILDDGTEKPYNIFDWTHKNYTLNDYTYWPKIKMDVAV